MLTKKDIMNEMETIFGKEEPKLPRLLEFLGQQNLPYMPPQIGEPVTEEKVEKSWAKKMETEEDVTKTYPFLGK